MAKRFAICAALTCAAVLAAFPCFADDYPSRPIRVVVGFSEQTTAATVATAQAAAEDCGASQLFFGAVQQFTVQLAVFITRNPSARRLRRLFCDSQFVQGRAVEDVLVPAPNDHDRRCEGDLI